MPNPMQIEGFFLEFDEKEMGVIRAALKSQGYEADGKGLKRMMMDVLTRHTRKPENKPVEETETDRLIRKTREFIEQNPHLVQMGTNMAMKMVQKAMLKTAK